MAKSETNLYIISLVIVATFSEQSVGHYPVYIELIENGIGVLLEG